MNFDKTFETIWARIRSGEEVASPAVETNLGDRLRRVRARLAKLERSSWMAWADLVSRVRGRPRRWEPLELSPEAAELQRVYNTLRMQARSQGETHPEIFASLAKLGVKGKSSHDAYRDIVLERRDELIEVLRTRSVDGIASYLAENFLVLLRGEAEPTFDDRRRAASTWAAIIAPSVALRMRADRALTIEKLVSLGSQWLAHGATIDAIDAAFHRDSLVRAFASHPARQYDLLTDVATMHKLDAGDVMMTMVAGIGLPLAAFIRTVELVSGQPQTATA